MTALLRLRLSELERQQKEASSSAGNGRNNCGRLQHADRARSSELLQNQLNCDDRDNWRSALGAVDLLV